MTYVLDAHNDLLTELAFRRNEERPFERYWLDHLVAGDVKLQVCPIYTADQPRGERVRRALAMVSAFHRALADRPDRVMWVRSVEDLDDALAGDRIGMLMALEGVEPLEDDPALAQELWELGLRMAGLTWNVRNRFATGGGEKDDTGLTEDGRRLVRRLREQGWVIDLAHASPRTFDDVLAICADQDGAPPVLTHAGCRAVYDSPRNVHDEQLRRLAAAGGVLGIMLLPLTVDIEHATLDRVVDHVDHAVSVMGESQVGIGSDFFAQIARSGAAGDDPAATLPPEQRISNMAADAVVEGLEGPQDFADLVAALRRRGWEGKRLDDLLIGNFVRVLRAALPRRGAV